MSKAFDEMLDRCLDRVLSGDTVEACLASYPKHALELEGPLRAAVQVNSAPSFTPSEAARVRGRRRIVAEMDALATGSSTLASARRPAWSRILSALGAQPWKAATAAIFMLVILGGGPTLITASSESLPGDVLYPLKERVELTRLAFQLSQEGKAELHLAFSERRVVEMSKLITLGKTGDLPVIQKKLNAHLRSVQRIADNLDGATAITVQEKVESRAAKALSGLQVSLATTEEKNREKASDTFQATSKSYGETVDRVVSKVPKVAAKGRGKLTLIAVQPADAWSSEVDSILVHLQRVEVLRAAGKDREWVALLTEPVDLDLLRLSRAGNFLGSAGLESGTFTKIRLSVSGATIVVAGTATPAKIHTRAITLTRPFQIKDGQTTVVLLDFEGKRSVRKGNDGVFTLLPVVRVLAREPVRTEPAIRPHTRPAFPARETELTETRSSATSISPRSVPVTPGKGTIEMQGEVTQVHGSGLVIRGKNITIAANATVDGSIEVGIQVRIHGQIDEKGGVIATNVQSRAIRPAPNTSTTVKRNPQRSSATPAPAPTATPPQTR